MFQKYHQNLQNYLKIMVAGRSSEEKLGNQKKSGNFIIRESQGFEKNLQKVREFL